MDHLGDRTISAQYLSLLNTIEMECWTKDQQWKKSIRRHKIRRWRADVYLLEKERHKEVVLLLVGDHEPLEVLRGHGPCS